MCILFVSTCVSSTTFMSGACRGPTRKSGPLELELQMLQAATWVLRPGSSERASLLLTTKPVCCALRSPCNHTPSLHLGTCNAKTSMAKTSKTRERPAAGKGRVELFPKQCPLWTKGAWRFYPENRNTPTQENTLWPGSFLSRNG